MTLNFDSYNTASTAIHVAQGCALLVLGLTEAYAGLETDRRIKLVSPAVFLLSGAAMALFMLYFLGGWSLDGAFGALKMKNGFFIFVSFACFYACAGFSLLTFLFSGEKSRGWWYLFLFFLAVIALLYFRVSTRVGSGAAAQVALYHSGLGVTLLAAVLLKFLHGFRPRRTFHFGWSALLLITSVQLLGYREVKGAFDLHVVSLNTEASQVVPAAPVKAVKNNAKTSPSERAGD